MGYGDYSYTAHTKIASSRAQKKASEVFTQRSVHPLMCPFGVGLRESRDSAEHPNSLPIIFALDVTGSMGQIPHQLAKAELPHFMKALLDAGVADPQVLFMAVGDIASDRGPLQVGQFESTAEDIDRWLTWSWLEGGGGGNGCESYDLAMYFAARHTETDSIAKRGKRGYFFMTGDEKPYPYTDQSSVKMVLGDEIDTAIPLAQVCDELSRVYHPFFLVPDPGRAPAICDAWREAMGDHVILMESPSDTCQVAAALVGLGEGYFADLNAVAKSLTAKGLERQRVNSVVRALTPFAATLGRDGTAGPRLEAIAP